MNKKKILISVAALILSALTAIILIVVNSDSATPDIDSQILQELEAESSLNETITEERNYSFSLNLNNAQEEYEYTGEAINLSLTIENSAQEFDYTFYIYVNGMLVPYYTDFDDEYENFHVFNVQQENSTTIEVYFVPQNCEVGDVALLCINGMLNPEYMLPDTSYVNFEPNHNLANLQPAKLIISSECENTIDSIYDSSVKEELTEEFEFSYQGYEDGEYQDWNYLDSGVYFNAFYADELEAYIECEDELELTIQGFGYSGKYLVSVYINNEIQQAFDGLQYAILNVDRDYMTTITANIDISNLQDLNHIYIIAVPCDYDQSVADDFILFPKKTNTTLLQIESDVDTTETQEEIIENSTVSSTESSVETTATNTDSTQTATNNSTDSSQEIEQSQYDSTITTSMVCDLVIISDTVIAVENFGSISLYDTTSQEFEYICDCSFSNTDKLQVIDNGFVIIGNAGAYIKFYDEKGNLEQTIYPPAYDNAKYVVSNDGTKLAYAYQDTTGTNHTYVYTMNIDGSNKTLVYEISPDDTALNTVQGIDSFTGYDGAEIYFICAVLIDTKPDYATSFGSINTNTGSTSVTKLTSSKYLTHNMSSVAGSFTVIEDYAITSSSASGTIQYQIYGEDLMSFTCESLDESRLAFLSENGEYIATIVNGESSSIIKIYELSDSNKVCEFYYDQEISFVKICNETKTAFVAFSTQVIQEDF